MKPLDRILDRIARLLGLLLICTSVLILLSPILFTILLSFANDASIKFPPGSWGVDRYVELFNSPKWLDSLGLSLRLAVASALIAVTVSLPALWAILRSQLKIRALIEQLSVASLLIPVSAFAVAIYGVFAQFRMLGSFWGLAVAHAVLAIPFVILIGAIGLRAQPKELELVAITLGASRARAFTGITLRLAFPSLIAGFVLAFQASFEEAVLVNFLGGPGLLTLPKRILDALQWGSEPVVTAIASIIAVLTSALVAVFLSITQGVKNK